LADPPFRPRAGALISGAHRFNDVSICGVGRSTTHNAHIDCVECPDSVLDRTVVVAGVVHVQTSNLEMPVAAMGEVGSSSFYFLSLMFRVRLQHARIEYS